MFFGYIGYKETNELSLSKNQTKWPIELWTLKQEMETDEDHATMRESFLLVQNILFIEYTDAFPAHVYENMVEKLWRVDANWFGFLIACFGVNL